MSAAVSVFRRSVARLEGCGRGLRYTEELRRRGAELTRSLRSAGWSLAAVSRSLGVSTPTLERWLERYEAVGMVEVSVVDSGGSSALLAIVTPDGFRVEGVARREVVALIGELRP